MGELKCFSNGIPPKICFFIKKKELFKNASICTWLINMSSNNLNTLLFNKYYRILIYTW